MTDLRDLLQRAAPPAPEFDRGGLQRAITHRNRRRRVTVIVSAVAIAAAVTVGIASKAGPDRHSIVVTPSPTTSSPLSTLPAVTATSAPQPARAAVAAIQTSAMPEEAFVAVGSSLIAVDTHDVAKRRTLTSFPKDAGLTWITADLAHGRVFFGVSSGCDPGVNGMYEIPVAGGTRRKIAPGGNRAAVSPDGTKLAYSLQTDGCGSRELVVQDVATGHRQTFTGHRSIEVGGWSSDGQSVFLDTTELSNGDTQTRSVYRFRPFSAGAQLDRSERWDTGIAADSGGGRVAIMDWCTTDSPSGPCVVGVRTRRDAATGPDYSFGKQENPDALSLDSSGQWPLLVSENPPASNVSYFAGGTWHVLTPGNAADW